MAPSRKGSVQAVIPDEARALRVMIVTEGADAIVRCTTGRLCALIADYLADCAQVARNTLTLSVQLGIHRDVQRAGISIGPADYNRLVRRLTDDAAFTPETADRILSAWLFGFWETLPRAGTAPPDEMRRPSGPRPGVGARHCLEPPSPVSRVANDSALLPEVHPQPFPWRAVAAIAVASAVALGVGLRLYRLGSDGASSSHEPAPRLRITRAPTALEIGLEQQLEAVIDNPPPGEATWPTVWSSSNPTVVRVSSLGVVTAGAEGRATITATAGRLRDRIRIEVVPPPCRRLVAHVWSLSLFGEKEDTRRVSELQLGLDESELLTASAETDDGGPYGSRVVWESSNEDVATIRADGHDIRVTGNSPGRATLTLTCPGERATVSVVVRNPAVETVTIEFANGTTCRLSVDRDGRILRARLGGVAELLTALGFSETFPATGRVEWIEGEDGARLVGFSATGCTITEELRILRSGLVVVLRPNGQLEVGTATFY